MKAIDLGNAVIVVTAASNSTGQAIAEAFARPGTKLILAGRDAHELKQLSARCGARGAETLTVDADISDTADTRRLVNAARAFGGRIDIWISRTEHDGEGDVADLAAVIPVFVSQKRGIFVNMTPVGLPATVRAPLAAHRSVCLCDVEVGSAVGPVAVARRVVDLVRAPRAKVLLGANDDFVVRALKSGTAFCMAALAGLGGVTTAMQAAKLG